LKKGGFEVIGVSPDEEKSHIKFREKFNLPFPLIADPRHKIIGKFGVWGEKAIVWQEICRPLPNHIFD
jgi:peroxiredoxin Q/BCP